LLDRFRWSRLSDEVHLTWVPTRENIDESRGIPCSDGNSPQKKSSISRKETNLRNLRKRIVPRSVLANTSELLFSGYKYCPNECPMLMANLGAALTKLPPGIAGQVKLVFVTTDPARDKPMELRRWLDNFDRRFVGLTRAPAALDAAQRSAAVPLAQKTDPGNGNYCNYARQFCRRVHQRQLGPRYLSRRS
jgi:cytochrome oxidase Cu insertion factor (SCO1/SenC/PrrC family)